jgi:hypothetical protein
MLKDLGGAKYILCILGKERARGCLFLFAPFVLLADSLLLFGCEVVLDVECLANLLWCLTLDHVGDGLACDVQQGFDIKVVSSLHCIVRTRELARMK